jgi:hypothetical protein
MTLPFHLFRLETRAAELEASNTDLRSVSKTDLQWGRPLFQAPLLPTPKQRAEEMQFASNFRAKDRLRR